MNYGKGYQPDPANKIYKPFDKSQVSNVSTENDIDLRPFSPPIKHHQGQTESCVGNATTRALEIKMIEKNGFDNFVPLSVMDLYWSARNLMEPKQTHVDGGVYISLAMDVLRTNGICRDHMWPWDPAKINVPPSILSIREESLNKISGHFKIMSTGNALIDDIVLNLKNHNPVVFGMDVGDEFKNFDSESSPISKLTNSVGGHALCIVGWINGKFVIENSWGNYYGVNGYCTIDPNFLVSPQCKANDFWVMQNEFDLFWEGKQ